MTTSNAKNQLAITIVRQCNPHSCFAASLESILRDQGVNFCHVSLIDRNPDLFHGGSEIKGSFALSHLPELSERCGLSFNSYELGTKQSNLCQSTGILLIMWMQDEPASTHCVRLLAKNDKSVMVMDPNIANFAVYPLSWVKLAIIVETKAD